MNFIVTGSTDIGLTKRTNQDSLLIRVFNTSAGRMVLAVMCDGMGGLSKGEVASATVIRAFDQWSLQELPQLCHSGITDTLIRSSWENVIHRENQKIMSYGKRLGIQLGTTVTAMLLTESRYYIVHVGDSRAYELHDRIRQLTKDQTLVAREVAQGLLTEEQAKVDSRRSVLLQCIGVTDEVYPEMFFGQTQLDAVYLLCCDGFIHELTLDELYQAFYPQAMYDEQIMQQASVNMIELNKQRCEEDNITVALIRTF